MAFLLACIKMVRENLSNQFFVLLKAGIIDLAGKTVCNSSVVHLANVRVAVFFWKCLAT